jgi:hypothetical protein
MSNTNRANIRNKIIETLEEVIDLIEKLHYHRRDKMLADLQTAAAQQGLANEPL